MKKITELLGILQIPRFKKLFRIMKLTCFLVLFSVGAVFASKSYSQSKRLNLEMEKSTIKEVLSEIEDQSEFYFMYSGKLINGNREVSVHFENQKVEEVLDILFAGTDVIYSVKDRIIVLTSSEVLTEESLAEFQQKSVTGIVSDRSGNPLPGVTILLKGTTKGVVSDVNGNYSISNISNDAVLVFSFVGMKKQEISVAGQTTINVTLVEDAIGVDEIIVTALGIERERKALGYAVSTIDAKQIEESGETNVIDALKGKVPGLTISSPNGLSDQGSSITIRGHSSISGNSQALVIVDGVPHGLSVIPTDIESVTVLRGPNASALYGSAGANGVILITTKKANNRRGLGVEINSGITLTEVATLPDLQNIWGQGKTTLGEFQGMGDDGIPLIGGGNKDETWGPKMEGQMVRINWLRDQPVVPFLPQPDNIRDLFQTGVHYVNSASISYATDKTTYYGSFMYKNADEYVPTAKTEQAYINMRITHQVTDRLSFDAKIDVNKSSVHNRPDASDHNSALNLATHPRSIRVEDIRPGIYPVSGQDWGEDRWADGQPILWTTTGNVDQYFWNLNEDSNDSSGKNFHGNFKVDYKLTDWLNVMLRYNHTEWVGESSRIWALNSWKKKDGQYNKSESNSTSRKSYFLFSGNKNFFGDQLNINGTFGGRQVQNNGSNYNFEGKEFIIEGLETPNNTLSKTYNYNEWDNANNSLYGTIQFGYKSMLYLDVTGRNDWTSSLPKTNNSYFYPSVTGSFIFSEVLNIDKKILNFGKVRASYAEVGNGGGGSIYKNYGFSTSSLGAVYASTPGTLPNFNLVPEKTKSTEFGLELRMLNNRIHVDATYYKANTYNQILGSQPLAQTTGYGGKSINGGNIENKGVELMLTAYAVKTKDFTWETNVIYAKNNSLVVDLGDEVDTQIDFGGNSAIRIVAIPGNSLRTITGQGFQRNDQGQILIKTDGSDKGIAMQTDEYIELGKVEADWTGSIKNRFTYKNISFHFQIDGSFGGYMFDGNNMAYDEQGTSVRSLIGREGWIASEEARVAAGSPSDWHNTGGVDVWVDNNTVLYDPSLIGEDGVQVGGVSNAGENAVYADPRKFWDRNRNDRAEHNIESATYVKFRELGLSYRLPKRMLANMPIKDVSLSVIANNPWLLYRETRHADPDAYRVGNNKGQLGITGYTAPPVRTFSFKLNLKF